MRKSIFAGVAIGLGCIAYISVENRYIGALLFSIGLVTICARRLNLFTGMLCMKSDVNDLISALIGNYIGVFIAVCLYIACANDFKAVCNIAQSKLNHGAVSVFASAILCEICICIAVTGFKEIQSDIGKYFSVVIGVCVFILSGFEHCIADVFYMFCNKDCSLFSAICFLVTVTVGNIVGAMICRFIVGENNRNECRDIKSAE